MNTVVSDFNSPIRVNISRRPAGSSALTGSSRSATRGRFINAWARPRRWRMPLLKPPMRRRATSCRPTRSNNSADRAWASRRRLLGYLPEEPHFYPWMTPQEFLTDFVGGLFRMPRREAQARTAELLERVGLHDVARRRIGGFSKGMRQRLGLAQALMNRPRVALLDEPVSALDPAGRRDMLTLIGELKSETTVFMSTHILDDVERICDSIGILRAGRLVALEGREALLERHAAPALEVHFDAPSEAVATWAAELQKHPFVSGVELDGSSVRIRSDGRVGTVDAVQRAVLGSALRVLRYQVARPSLEDVFLRL